uniref:Uncharacterized protein n=1 Tax=Bionectria ochroleuca TaxID=29856 RepID=A0A8H7NQ01_BIOOC
MSQPLHIKHSQARIPLMDPVLYSLGDTISDFFASRAPVTQQQCDDLAVSLVGGPVNPVPIQGSSSYTVTAGSQQIQDCSISRCEFRFGYAHLKPSSTNSWTALWRRIPFHGKVKQLAPADKPAPSVAVGKE